jgi:2-polyprenyl-3-methyl-5-hydroxy-6-metoxy-1,4-benzoquinol methylase
VEIKMNKPLDKIIRFFRFRILFKNLPVCFTNLLDIGCGRNPWFLQNTRIYTDLTRIHTDRTINITAIDSGDFTFVNSPVKFNFIKYKIKDTLPFKDNQFDLITMLAVLEHLEQPEIVIKEIYRILKPAGTFIMTTPSKLAKLILEFSAFKLHLIDERSIADHKRYFNKKELSKILSSSGFIIEKISYFELGCNLFAKSIKS